MAGTWQVHHLAWPGDVPAQSVMAGMWKVYGRYMAGTYHLAWPGDVPAQVSHGRYVEGIWQVHGGHIT